MLILRVIETVGKPTGVLMLCDELGKSLPMQAGVELSQSAAGRDEVTFTFVIDGKNVRFERPGEFD